MMLLVRSMLLGAVLLGAVVTPPMGWFAIRWLFVPVSQRDSATFAYLSISGLWWLLALCCLVAACRLLRTWPR